MGLSSSQGRLLSITARLTSNEYESQQISNAKMRLATQSQEASAQYIAALNSQQLLFVSYDAQGQAVKENLTASSLYQYTEMKNQYVLSNNAGQALLPASDIAIFKKAKTLDQFLTAYGIEKVWKSDTLEKNYEIMQEAEQPAGAKYIWDEKIDEIKSKTYGTHSDGTPITATEQWQTENMNTYAVYMNAMAEYERAQLQVANGIQVSNMNALVNALSDAKQAYTDTITIDAWATARAVYVAPKTSTTTIDGENITLYKYSGNQSPEYINMKDYNVAKAEFDAEARDYGTSLDDLYSYKDPEKAQWYINLWYRMNGSSTNKSTDGDAGTYYAKLDSKLLTSNSWIKDALSQGIVTLEKASNNDTPNTVASDSSLTVLKLNGIKWDSTIYTNSSNFTIKDDDQAIARAEAEYTRKTQEITMKDEKYQNKIKKLETEHTSLQTEYESVQSALNKNIERSYKAFNA